MKIALQPIGAIAEGTLEALKARINRSFGSPVEIRQSITLPREYLNIERKQYLAHKLIELVKQSGKAHDEIVLGVVDEDTFAPELNFVFGEADMSAGIAVISLTRLRQEYYGLERDDAKFSDRAAKEAVHELGHTFGLLHCPDPDCVMHFSNSLADTDWKKDSFCSRCRPKLFP